MFEALLGVLAPVVDPDSRLALEQFVPRRVQFYSEVTELERTRYAYKGRRIYKILTRLASKDEIAIVSSSDPYSCGLVFFPPCLEDYTRPASTENVGPNVLLPTPGQISAEYVAASEREFVLFVATVNALTVGYVDVRYCLANDRQTQHRTLIKVPMTKNSIPENWSSIAASPGSQDARTH
jgi:hypothetical protein